MAALIFLHGLLHFLGVDQGCPYGSWNAYNFFSGSGSDIGELAIFGGVIGIYRRHNCHERRCWRIGRHVVDGTPWCDTHHGAARVTVAAVTVTAGIGRKGARAARE